MKTRLIACLVVFALFSCEDLTEVNKNPNGIEATDVNPDLILPTVLTEGAKAYTNLGFGDIAGVMQHTQYDAWADSHNDYNWYDQSWSTYYGVLRNNKLVYDRGVELESKFHQGVALTMKSFMFGLITDLWGDAPYSAALNGETPGIENSQAKFDNQEDIYKGIIADLKTANQLLADFDAANPGYKNDVDVYFDGNALAWRKMANSLMLRYYLRISSKLPSDAKTGIDQIVSDPAQFPIITDPGDDAVMDYAGHNADDSWPSNSVYDASGSNFRRIKMCATFVDKLQSLNDPRLDLWAKKVEIPLFIDDTMLPGGDEIIDGVRHLAPDVVEDVIIDTDPDYVGIPPSFSALPSAYNMNPTPGQLSYNPHVSFLSDMYQEANGDLLKARLISAAEVHFILAEAALMDGDKDEAADRYNAAIAASLQTWGLADAYDDYIAQPAVEFDKTASLEKLQQLIIEQKWIASWTVATESWFDYRRTGFPDLATGISAKRDKMPLRFYYMQAEIRLNADNTSSAIDRLEVTGFSQADGKNSAWSKPWLIQGTGKPWN
ncbi:Starch-binding associating with outer membrane [Chryseolinea serpens]|uniref:Starch-binding associating with outer membrane n=1 Tax=Chryseolinea serpens TaxID=947013 RepID=A0A1M5MX17_9BACT|nr:SusD/RagB family nutrient-binding outer membrane lipoprotein [Chryseolinea serpens]SHG81864.1 Starch-binding associating with outer membrane [Chryseolinea serpens]